MLVITVSIRTCSLNGKFFVRFHKLCINIHTRGGRSKLKKVSEYDMRKKIISVISTV